MRSSTSKRRGRLRDEAVDGGNASPGPGFSTGWVQLDLFVGKTPVEAEEEAEETLLGGREASFEASGSGQARALARP